MRQLVKRALIVDDATTIRAYLREILEEAGFVVEEAINGLEGLERALTAPVPPELLVVDVNMPLMDGYRLLHAVRGEPVLSDVPAIVLTTDSRAQQINLAFESGANLFLTKPVRPETMARFARVLSGCMQEAAT